MTVFIVLCFIVMVGMVIVAYLLSSERKPLPVPVEPEKKNVVEVEKMSPQEKWTIRSIQENFDGVKDYIHYLPGINDRPQKMEAVKGFFSRVNYAFRLTMQEKEIVFFAVLQWVAVAIAYFLWVQMLDWIPPEVWKSAAESDDGSIADWILLAWSFVCVGAAAFPLSIFSACMGTVHFLRRQGKPSSIAACLKIVLPKAWSLWIFQWIDGWITVTQILERLPKKKNRRTPAQKALSEALYFAWKLGTIGILPSLITGRGLVESCQKSLAIVSHKTRETVTLRLGYSAVCWVIGIAAYIGAIVFFGAFSDLIPQHEEFYSHIYTFYFWAAVPILIAVGIVQMLLRPIYVIASCDIFSDYLEEKQEKIMLPSSPAPSTSALVAFGCLLLLMGSIFLYRDQLGITQMLATRYGDKFYASDIPGNASAEELVNQGWALQNQGQLTKAVAFYNKALEVDSNSYLAHKHKGIYFSVKGNYTEAVAALTKAIELNPAHASSFYNRGLIHQGAKNYNEAVADYTEAIALEPNYYNAISNRGTVHLILENYTEAVEDFSRSLSLNPNSAQVYMYRGLSYLNLGDESSAENDFNQAIALDPKKEKEITAWKQKITSK